MRNLFHKIRVFFQRRKARKIVALMKLDEWQSTSLKYYPIAKAFCADSHSDLVLKIENKRRELGYSQPYEIKVFSIKKNNKILWFHEHPNGERELVKEIDLNGKKKSN